MNDHFLTVSSSPHIRAAHSTNTIMRDVVIALVPALIAGIIFFGINAAVLTIICVLTSVATEAIIQRLMKKEVTINDWSAAVTGVLLGLNLPASAPWWLAVIGSVFAIGIVKQCFGGIGQNFINPALAGRALLVASWPVRMTSAAFADATTSATPLALIKSGVTEGLPSYMDLFLGNVAGSMGEVSALALLIGGLYLIIRKVISWRIPVVFIGTVMIFTVVFGQDPIYHLLSGGLLLGAFFMATDYASSPVTPRAQIIFALGCGILTSVIRLWGGYPEGVSYSILLMNICTPLIERVTVPRVYGEVKTDA
ncbi:RnfABCDGE type electron transport complex subunit D [Alkalibaculum sp. M08DMB]|uniref:Ion-translocating oxidoreductase complex subunit D n=1 Tax=Alkalibaculum sporogenes TaxID=2655001 RepID=A0A6A7K640_9FIRM|nr:RnfABCDGE type electron transport complex subunit D [Alkalibaculum sporogenes]MPW24834.1 RnfABCDGE type electron transport complex subunit D [Alkalibaculum sporogenes]